MAALEENYQQPAKVQDDSTVAADSQLIKCFRFGHRQVIRFNFNIADTKRYLTCRARKGQLRPVQSAQLEHIPSQYILLDRHINSSVQVKLVLIRSILD